jgi:outer membrane lipoprotein-sorting protein
MIRFFTLFFSLFLITFSCFSQDAVAQNKISDKQILQKAENYFNNLKNLKAIFVQMSSYDDANNYNENSIVGGKIYINRPNKMRLEYDKNVPILIIADGHFLIYYDKNLQQVTHIGLDNTPAGIMLKENLSFSDDRINITKIYQDKGVYEISLVLKGDPMAGELTLVFSDIPFALKQWRIKDAHNVTTTVSLMNIEKGIKLNPKLFKFKDPRKKDNLGYNPSSKK